MKLAKTQPGFSTAFFASKNIALALFGLFFFTALRAQTPTIAWQNTIGGNAADELVASRQTSDGGYIFGGSSLSNISSDKSENSMGNYDFWVVKTDATGAILWQNTIGGNDYDKLSALRETSDGGFILGGTSNSNISGDKTENAQGPYSDFWVVKLNAGGNIEWQNTIGGFYDDRLTDLQQTSDGGYLLGGNSSSNISGDKTENVLGSQDFWVVKLNALGTILWQNTIGGNGNDQMIGLQQTADGGFILGGSSESDISGDKTENSQGGFDYWVLKLDASGNISWQNTIGGGGGDIAAAIQQTTDGGYVVGGISYSGMDGDKTESTRGIGDYWVLKLDATGSIVWQKTLGGSANDEFHALQQTSDGGYLLGGTSFSVVSGDKTEAPRGGADYWLVKLNFNGNLLWQKSIGGSLNDLLFSLQQTSDGGYILGGQSISDVSGEKTENSQGNVDYWAVKLSCEVPATFTVALPGCPGESNGKITTNPYGGTTYNYLWNNNLSTRTITGLSAGNYAVTIGTDLGCQAVYGNVYVPNPPSIMLSLVKVHPNCIGSNGKLTVNAVGGTGTKTYIWSTGATTKILSGGSANVNYSVTVTDTKGCTASASAVLQQPLPPGIGSVYIAALSNGKFKATVNAFGGTTPYKYRKCPDGAACSNWGAGNVFTNLVAGLYTFEVLDKNLCTASITMSVPAGSGNRPAAAADRSATDIENDFENEVKIYPNPVRGGIVWIDFSKILDEKISLRLVSISGKTLRSEFLEKTSSAETLSLDVADLPNGLYFLEIKTENGAAKTEKLMVDNER